MSGNAFAWPRRSAWRAGALLGLSLFVGACGRSDGGDGTATPTIGPVGGVAGVLAEARVLPVSSVALGLRGGGRVLKIAVEEGQAVKAGAELLRVSGGAQAAALLDAEAALRAAEAGLAQVQKGAAAETLAASEAAVEVADAELRAATARVSAADAGLTRISTGSADEVSIAERRFEQAKNTRWGLQAQRDAVCGRVKEKLAFTQADCDQAQANVQAAEETVRIAELEYGKLKRGTAKEDVAVARAQVGEAEGARAAAAARLRQARAELDRMRRGASSEELIIATAGVERARAALELARLNMDDTLLLAPFAGTVAALEAVEGQILAPDIPAVRLADVSRWQVETEDLTELSVVGIREGDAARVTFDAIDGLTLPGKVARVRSFGESRLGDITYRVTIALDRQDDRLRWNMTASAAIEPSGKR